MPLYEIGNDNEESKPPEIISTKPKTNRLDIEEKTQIIF